MKKILIKTLIIASLIIFTPLFSQEDKFYYTKKWHTEISVSGPFGIWGNLLLEYRFFKFFATGLELAFWPVSNEVILYPKIRTALHIPFFVFDLYLGISVNYLVANIGTDDFFHMPGGTLFTGLRIGGKFLGITLESGIDMPMFYYAKVGIYFRF